MVNANSPGVPPQPPVHHASRARSQRGVATIAALALCAGGLVATGVLSSQAFANEADCLAYYAANPNFDLDAARDVDPMPTNAQPDRGESFTDPYGTCVTRATDYRTDFDAENWDAPATNARSYYARLQAFNADSSMYLIAASNGTWHVYDAATNSRIKQLDDVRGEAEPQWDTTDPDKLIYLDRLGADAKVYELTVSTNTSQVLTDFGPRISKIWPEATSVWTDQTGSPSADGRYNCFMAYGDGWNNLGLFVWDRTADEIISSHDLNGEQPTSVSMSPSGKYCVTGTPGDRETRSSIAYSRDFSEQKVLPAPEHSDIALAEDGSDVYVSGDFDSGDIYTINLDTMERTDVIDLYLNRTNMSFHVSGKAFSKPGWALMSTYAWGRLDADSERQWMHDKVFALKLDGSGEIRNLAFNRSQEQIGPDGNPEGKAYWAEPQATVNDDFTRILFNSNWGNQDNVDDVDTYMITLPKGVLDQPGLNNPGPLQDLVISVDSAATTGDSSEYTLSTNLPAACAVSSVPGASYRGLSDHMDASSDGLTHTSSLPAGGTHYAVCKVTNREEEAQVKLDARGPQPTAIPEPTPTATPEPTPTVTPEPTATPTPGELAITVKSTSVIGYQASYELSTTTSAECRQSTLPGVGYGALYDPIDSSSDGLTHTKSLNLGTPQGTTVYAVCRAGEERAEVAVELRP